MGRVCDPIVSVGRQEVIETETGMKSGFSVPALAVRGNRDGKGMHEMRSIPEKSVALYRQCPKPTEIESLKAAHSPMNYTQRVAGTGGGEVTLFHQGHRKTPEGSLPCN